MAKKWFVTAAVLVVFAAPLFAGIKEAMFGMGCFWNAEYQFSKIKGVVYAEVGYVCEDRKYPNPNGTASLACYTGGWCTEVVRIKYDDKVLTYEKLLSDFWSLHDASLPTDISYRSAVYYFDRGQKKAAEKMMAEISKKKRVFTLIEKAGNYKKAPEYHQDYIRKRS